ncbi:MAG: HupE/UreJ family protein [Oricola sp.]
MNSACKKILGVAALTLAASPAFAHTGHGVSGLQAGIVHPILGPDHLMAMVAVGVWSAAQPARLAWRGPVAFVAMLAAGALLGVGGIPLPFVEPGILASVVVLGLMIATARVFPAGLGLVVIGGFALLHGHAHGTEAAGALTGYMAGFMATSVLLHATGYGAGRLVAGMRYGTIAAGVAVAAGGLALAGA